MMVGDRLLSIDLGFENQLINLLKGVSFKEVVGTGYSSAIHTIFSYAESAFMAGERL